MAIVPVGRVGVPVKVGEAMFALRLMLFWRVVSALDRVDISVASPHERVAMLPLQTVVLLLQRQHT